MAIENVAAWVSLIKDCVLMIAATIGAVVGVIGLRTWQRQLSGTTEYELVRKLLGHVYTIRDAVNRLRSPDFPGKEIPTSKVVVGEELSSQEFRRHLASAYESRWAAVQEAFSKLDVTCAEAEVVWGKRISSLVHALRSCRQQLEFAAYHYFAWIADVELHRKIPERFGQEIQSIMVRPEEANSDYFGKKFHKCLSDFEEVLKS